jgi:hypothetical protein
VSSVFSGVLVLCALCQLSAAEPAFTISDEFVRYIESATNPEGFGLGADGRFRPYSTPQGRRIGYRQAVWDEALYEKGCTREEAEARLRADLGRTLSDVRAFLATNAPPRAFESLTAEGQEILVDLASSEGVAGLKPAAVDTVAAADWGRFVSGMLYIRTFGTTLDNLRNRAFAKRWLETGRLPGAKAAAGGGTAKYCRARVDPAQGV